jgi:hypothetical protein
MVDTQMLLGQIVALRERLGQVQALTPAAESVATALPAAPDAGTILQAVTERTGAGSAHGSILDGSLRQLAVQTGTLPEEAIRPEQLTARARRLLERGQALLQRMRLLSEEPLLGRDEDDPLDALFRESAAVLDIALRIVQAFPDGASAQLRLCQGLDAVLDLVETRTRAVGSALARRRRDMARIGELAEVFRALTTAPPLEATCLDALVVELLDEAHQAAPLRFLYELPDDPPRHVACHALTVAAVVARVVRHHPEFRGRPDEPVLAALVFDAGMAVVPADILSNPGPLSREQRRTIEGHTIAGARLLAHLRPGCDWLAAAAAGHHERLDGTGYPDGLQGAQVTPLNRLLAVCDVYAALCTPRPYRPAMETRAALTATLTLAEKGLLDRSHAERLLVLSFYPIGSVVELSDGSMALVIATRADRRDLHSLARPVVALLTDSQGRSLPAPQYVDLAQAEDRVVVRSLLPADRCRFLGKMYPEAA